MAMPNHLVLVRHGESEGNYYRNEFKNDSEGELAYLLYQFRERPGDDWRLTPKGVEQAQAAGEWIQENIIKAYGLPGFDRYVYSPHRRTVETAGHLGLPNAEWRLDRRLRERSWGEIENVTGEEEHRQLFPRNYAWMLRDPLNWTPPGGMSIPALADTQVRGFLDTAHRDHDQKAVESIIASTHGEWMLGAYMVLGYLFNEDWLKAKQDPAFKIHNCQVWEFSRLNPDGGEQAAYLKWMRSVNPYRKEFGGWMQLGRRTLSNTEMIAMAERLPRIEEA